jgi:hypothetical protein
MLYTLKYRVQALIPLSFLLPADNTQLQSRTDVPRFDLLGTSRTLVYMHQYNTSNIKPVGISSGKCWQLLTSYLITLCHGPSGHFGITVPLDINSVNLKHSEKAVTL